MKGAAVHASILYLSRGLVQAFKGNYGLVEIELIMNFFFLMLGNRMIILLPQSP